MKENLVVYDALRDQILQCQSIIINETINMYLVYFALFSLGFSYIWLFLVSFIVLLVFQSMINCHLWEVRKATKYIEIFFEIPRCDIHWEKLHRYDIYQSAVSKSKIRNMDWYIRNNGSLFLAILSLLSFSSVSIYNNGFQIQDLPITDIIGIASALILCLLVIHVNRLFFRIDSMGRNEDDELTAAIRAFYNSENEKVFSDSKIG